MSEMKPLREFWIWKEYDKKTLAFTAQAQKPVHIDKCFHVREVSAEYDAAVGDLSDFIDVFLYTNRSRGYPTGTEWLELVRIAERARKAFDAAAKGLK